MHGCRTRLSLQESYAEVGEGEAGEGLWTVRIQGFSTAGVQRPQYYLGGLSRGQISIRAKKKKVSRCFVCTSYLPSGAGCGARVTGCAQRARLTEIIGQTKLQAAVVRKQLQSFPGLPKVSRTFDGHGGRPRRPEHQNHVGQTEARLQVQADLIPMPVQVGGRAGRPPGIRMGEGVVGHVNRWVGALGAKVGRRRSVGTRPVMSGGVPAAAREGEEGPAAG